jgi:hypothetical protein
MNGKRNDEWEGVIFVKKKCCRLNFSSYPIFNMDSNLETKTFPGLRRKPERIILGSGKNDFFVIFYNMTLYVCINIIGRVDPLP